MRLLVLGGPRFLGRAVADAALARGHELTFFNRGRTNPDLYPEVERIVGDRLDTLDGLAGHAWDAVIDTSGYLPRALRTSTAALAGCGLYCFVSSVSVYASLERVNDEDAPVAQLGELPEDEVTEASYGPLKAICEEIVREAFGERALVVRPGLIAGPHDPTGRFTYWPHRFTRGGEVLAPAPPERLTQLIDVRDLAEWMVGLCEREAAGTFNADGPASSWSELVDACRTAVAGDGTVTWVPDDFLLEHAVGPWMELPLWIPDERVDARHASVERALAAGLTHRPLVETARGALEHAEPTEAAGLRPEREAAVLAAWHARS